MRSNVRRRNRGSWELTVDLGRHAGGPLGASVPHGAGYQGGGGASVERYAP